MAFEDYAQPIGVDRYCRKPFAPTMSRPLPRWYNVYMHLIRAREFEAAQLVMVQNIHGKAGE